MRLRKDFGGGHGGRALSCLDWDRPALHSGWRNPGQWTLMSAQETRLCFESSPLPWRCSLPRLPPAPCNAALAGPSAGRGQQQAESGQARPERIRNVTISANEKCPAPVGDEVVVCSTLTEPYRIPKALRNPPSEVECAARIRASGQSRRDDRRRSGAPGWRPARYLFAGRLGRGDGMHRADAAVSGPPSKAEKRRGEP